MSAKTLCSVLLVVVATVTLGSAAQGQVLVYEIDDEPLFEIDFPSGWLVDLDFKDEARAAGAYTEGEELRIRIVEANPGDGAEIWVGLWAIPDVTDLDEGMDYVASLNSDLFSEIEMSRPEEREINGMPARVMTATAVHDGQDVELLLALFVPRADTVAAGLYVGATDIWREYESELRGMMSSLQPAD